MSFKSTIIGRVYSIGPTETVGQNGAQKRSVVIVDEQRGSNGDTYRKFVEVEFWKDKVGLLDQFVQNQLVQIEAFVESRYYEGNGRWYTSVRGWTIQQYVAPNYGQQPTQQTYTPQPQYQPAPQPNPYQQQMQQKFPPETFFTKPGADQLANPFPQAAPPQAPAPNMDPLPF